MHNMNFESFSEMVRGDLERQLEGTKVNVRDVTKNNGLTLKGLTFLKEGEQISPVIYLERFHKEYLYGKTLEEIESEIITFYEENRNCTFSQLDIDAVTDFDKMRDSVRFRIINYDKNIERYKERPHRKLLDLMCIYYIDCGTGNNGGGQGCIVINKAIFTVWNITENELWETALSNMVKYDTASFASMEDVIEEIIGDESFTDAQEFTNPMCIVSNKSKLYGASVMFYPDCMERIKEYFKSDFYILPSSVHEIIVIPKDERIQEQALHEMVREVNSTQVAPDEVLSDNVYKYEGNVLKLVAA